MGGGDAGIQSRDKVAVEDVVLSIDSVVEVDLLDSAGKRTQEDPIASVGHCEKVAFGQFPGGVADCISVWIYNDLVVEHCLVVLEVDGLDSIVNEEAVDL